MDKVYDINKNTPIEILKRSKLNVGDISCICSSIRKYLDH